MRSDQHRTAWGRLKPPVPEPPLRWAANDNTVTSGRLVVEQHTEGCDVAVLIEIFDAIIGSATEVIAGSCPSAANDNNGDVDARA